MSEILTLLGVERDELDWQDLSLCKGMDTRLFYDDYESNPDIAIQMDQACLSCPVLLQCGLAGAERSEYGLWGAIYLTAGSPDASRNTHKTPAIWEQIKKRYGGK